MLLTEHSSLQLDWLLSLKALLHTAHSVADRTQFTAAEVTAVTRSTAAYRSQCCWQNTVHCSWLTAVTYSSQCYWQNTVHCIWSDCCHLKHWCIQLTVVLPEHSSLQLKWLLSLEAMPHTDHRAADRTQFTAAELTAVTYSSQYYWQNTVHYSWTDCCHLKHCCIQLTVLLTEHSSLQLNWLLSLTAHSVADRTQFTAAGLTAVT